MQITSQGSARFVVYEELWGNYCYETCKINAGEVQLSYGERVHRIYNNLNERIADCQRLEEGPKWRHFGGIISCNYHDYISELKPSKVVWHYKKVFSHEDTTDYFYAFRTESEAKECCYILNEAEKYLGIESCKLTKHPKKYIKVPFYYCEGNQIIEKIPQTQFDVQKLFAYKKNKVCDFKPTVIKSVLKWGWENSEFQLLEGKEYLKKVLEKEDSSVAQRRKELAKQYEIEEQNKPFCIDYITFKNTDKKNTYKFNLKKFNDLSSLGSCVVKVKRCGNRGTFGYPKELENQLALFIPIDKNIYQYTSTIPGTNKQYAFHEMFKYDLEFFYECMLLDYQTCKNPRIEKILVYLSRSAIINENDFYTLYKPCHMHEVFPDLTEKEIELLLSNPQSASVIAERDHLREILGDPTFE